MSIFIPVTNYDGACDTADVNDDYKKLFGGHENLPFESPPSKQF